VNFVTKSAVKTGKKSFFSYEFEVDYKYSAKVSWANQHVKVAWSSLNGLKPVK
jgi:hypothetical protein